MKIGMLFPGQGTQFVGMCKSLYDQERIVQEHFELASSCLDNNLVKLCFASSEEQLRQTVNSQTAIFVVSASIYALLHKKYGITPDLVAGHSLGEYTAIHAAGGINFPDGLYLLKKRSVFMEECMKSQNGGMLAVLGFAEDKLKRICELYDEPDTNDCVAEVVNYNSPSQLIVSGTLPELHMVKHDVQILGGKSLMLPVSGAFHSRLLRKAEIDFVPYLFKADFKPLKIPLVNNVMAQVIKSPEEIKLSMVKQTSSPVYWWQSMQFFKDLDVIVEVGPNDKFKKMLKREWPEKIILSINEQADINELLKLLGKPIPEIEYDDE